VTGDFYLLAWSAWLALCSVLVLALPAVGLGYWLAQPGARGLRVAVEAACMLPLVLPPTAVGLVLLEVFAVQGPLGAGLERLGLELVFTPAGVVLAGAVMGLPLWLRSARGAFEQVDGRLVAVARTLGRTRWGAFLAVELPLAARGLLAGGLLAFCRALGEFGATILLAGNIPGRTQTVPLAIFQRAQAGDDAGALRLVGLVTAAAFGLVLVHEWLVQRGRGARA
jgi:molybdate transport system permease protein